MVWSWENIHVYFQDIRKKCSICAVYYPIFLVVLPLDDILRIALSILHQHLEKLMTLFTEVYSFL